MKDGFIRRWGGEAGLEDIRTGAISTGLEVRFKGLTIAKYVKEQPISRKDKRLKCGLCFRTVHKSRDSILAHQNIYHNQNTVVSRKVSEIVINYYHQIPTKVYDTNHKIKWVNEIGTKNDIFFRQLWDNVVRELTDRKRAEKNEIKKYERFLEFNRAVKGWVDYHIYKKFLTELEPELTEYLNDNEEPKENLEFRDFIIEEEKKEDKPT